MATRCPAPARGGHPVALTRPLTCYLLPQMQTTATATRCAPVRVPADISAHLARFGLTLGDLLTDSNPKMQKGSAQAVGVILHHLPARALAAAVTPGHRGSTAPRSYLPALAHLADREGLGEQARAHNGCPWATAGCAAGCLNWAGHGGLSPAVAAARGRRTLAMLADPGLYGRAILWAIVRAWARAQAQGLPLAVRLRGTDEGPRCGWHRLGLLVPVADAVALAHRFGAAISPGAVTLAEALGVARADGSLKLYEYSKAPLSGPLGLWAQADAGFDVTASLAADRATAVADAAAAVRAGFRLAVPVALRKGQPLPVALTLAPDHGPAVTMPCVNGDLSDHRWADPEGVAVILRSKVSRGAGPEAAPFHLAPIADAQPLADGAARLVWAP
jgi:hypothetical protein